MRATRVLVVFHIILAAFPGTCCWHFPRTGNEGAICLSLLDHVDDQGIVITKHGKPVAKLVRIESSSSNLIGALKGKLKIKGDIFSTGERWNAES
jgi:antitoxin (DNA-binding transcriptional repressor) of toxin-antitoxin stability system